MDRLRRDGADDDGRQVERFLDCRYVGQGYELRIPVRRRPATPTRRSRRSTRAHRAEYGHAFGDPIEIVNLRVTATRTAARSSSA